MPTPAEIKKALIAAGFEVYRTRGDVVHVAERVRENLIMDSGVRVHAEGSVAFVVRAQRSDFPNEPEEGMFERARKLGAAAVARGYQEVGQQMTRVPDPSDEGRTLDTWHEVSFQKPVASLDEAMAEVRFVLSLEKTASRS
jgi:hypothetical protein